MIHLPTVHMCTNFQSSRPHSSQEKCDEKFQCWKLERKKNEIKEQISSSSLIRYTWYICPLSTCVSSFNLLGLTVPKKSVMKNFNVENWREKNEEINGWISSSSLIPVDMIHLPTAHMCTKFQSSRPHSSQEKWWWKILMFERSTELGRFHNMSTENLIRPQGHVTPKWLIQSGWNLKSSKILMPVLVTSKFDGDPIKNEQASLEIPFSHYKSMGNL